MILCVEVELGGDGRWLADVTSLPGVMAYGATRLEAIETVKTASLRVLLDQVVAGKLEGFDGVTFDVFDALSPQAATILAESLERARADVASGRPLTPWRDFSGYAAEDPDEYDDEIGQTGKTVGETVKAARAHGPGAFALAQLRHLYTLMLDGHVRDTREAARMLLGPSIERLEVLLTSMAPPVTDGASCSFCGKVKGDVKKMVMGAVVTIGRHVHICDECIGLCHDIVKGEHEHDEASP